MFPTSTNCITSSVVCKIEMRRTCFLSLYLQRLVVILDDVPRNADSHPLCKLMFLVYVGRKFSHERFTAGSTADALTLFEQLEMKLEAHPGALPPAANGWRFTSSWKKILQEWILKTTVCQSNSWKQPFNLSTGQLSRAAVELAKLWRTDKYLRKLDVSVIAIFGWDIQSPQDSTA